MASLLDLKTFVLVARSGSFAKAGRSLNVSATMVARRVADLEAEFGARLLERTTRYQKLTGLGEQLLERSLRVVAEAEAVDELRDRDGTALSGSIRLSAPTTLGVTQIAAVATEFCAQNPGATVDVSFNNRRVDLVGEGFDVAIRVGELQNSSLVVRKIGVYRLVCCAAPVWIARCGRPGAPAELANSPAIINANLSPDTVWHFVTRDRKAAPAQVAGTLRMDNDEAQRRAALAVLGCAYLPLDLVREDLTDGGLVQLLPEWETVSMPIYAVFPVPPVPAAAGRGACRSDRPRPKPGNTRTTLYKRASVAC